MRGRKLVVIDVRKTDTAEISDIFIKVKPNQDFELLSALRLALFSPSDVKDSAGVKADTIIELANLMKSATMGAIFFGLGLTMSQGKHRNIDIAINLTKDLNKFTKFIIMPMRGHFNVTGFNVVCTWQTGFPFSVDFSRGYPRYNPGEFSAVNALQRHEVDCALIVASDPVSHFPKIAVDYLLNIPVITLDPFLSPTGAISQVFIPAAISGIECDGTAYRMDHVPIRLKKIIDGKYPSDKVILEKILEGVSK
jgi:formylmethanofuran dehydrogenase subunit B